MAERSSGISGGIYFKVTDEERGLIEQKMALAGVHNMSAYIHPPRAADGNLFPSSRAAPKSQAPRLSRGALTVSVTRRWRRVSPVKTG